MLDLMLLAAECIGMRLGGSALGFHACLAGWDSLMTWRLQGLTLSECLPVSKGGAFCAGVAGVAGAAWCSWCLGLGRALCAGGQWLSAFGMLICACWLWDPVLGWLDGGLS